jgi:hypothetical protein
MFGRKKLLARIDELLQENSDLHDKLAALSQKSSLNVERVTVKHQALAAPYGSALRGSTLTPPPRSDDAYNSLLTTAMLVAASDDTPSYALPSPTPDTGFQGGGGDFGGGGASGSWDSSTSSDTSSSSVDSGSSSNSDTSSF